MASTEIARIPKNYRVKQIHIKGLIYEEVTLSNGLVYYQGPMRYSPLARGIMRVFDELGKVVRRVCEDLADTMQKLGEGPHGYPSSPLGRALRSADEQANLEYLRHYLPPMRTRRRQDRRPHNTQKRRRQRRLIQPPAGTPAVQRSQARYATRTVVYGTSITAYGNPCHPVETVGLISNVV